MHDRTARRGNPTMNTAGWIISTVPEIFLLLAIAIGTFLGRIRIRGFALGTTACTLIVAVLIGQIGTFTFPAVLKRGAESQTAVLGVAVPYAVGNVVLTVLGPVIVAHTFVG
jgi:hypothetical protein